MAAKRRDPPTTKPIVPAGAEARASDGLHREELFALLQRLRNELDAFFDDVGVHPKKSRPREWRKN
jgi:glycyl-tRNA synthetase beta subunit